MKFEEFKGIALIRQTSSNGKDGEKYSEETGLPLVRFDSHRNPFLMLESTCNNPECNCREINLSFTEISDSGYPVFNPLWFSICLDLKKWKEKRIVERPEISQRFVDEFINSLTNEMKTRFKETYLRAKEKWWNASQFKMSIDEIKRGRLVPYVDVFGQTGSILYGGKEVGFRFEYEGDNYFIDDHYCMNPACDCETVHLVFLKSDKKEKGVLLELFIGILSLKNGLKIEESSECSKETARKIFNSWKDIDTIDVLEKRYQEMKKIGQKIVTEHDT